MSLSRFSRRLALAAGLSGVFGALLAGCGGGGSSTPNNGGGGSTTPVTVNLPAPGTSPFVNSSNASRPVFQQNAHQNGRARWTVLVYLNAASNLQPFSLINIAQMASIGTNADLNIVVQWKQTRQSKFFPSVAIDTTPSFVGTRRYLITKHSQSDLNRIAPNGIASNTSLVGDTSVLDGDRLADPPTATINDNGSMTADMGSYRTLADFVQWGSQNFPADHLAVVVWDHGSGALNVNSRAAKSGKLRRGTPTTVGVKKLTRGLSQDVQTGSQIATQELPLGLANTAQKIDALIIDCSLQGTTELAYDVRNSARILVASEESPPGTGYPYDAWLGFLQSTPASPGDCGANLITDTIAAYPNETNITQAMTDLSKMDNVANALNSFGGSLRNYTTSQANLIKTARQSAQFFDFIEYKDLYHFADLIRTSGNLPNDLGQAAANVETSLLGTSGAILMSAHDPNGQEAKASGLSIFLPGPQTPSSVDDTTGFDPQWNNLGIAKVAPNWAAFLKAQTQ